MYQLYTLLRLIPAPGEPNPRGRIFNALVFLEAAPKAEGFHDIPRQSVRLQEMEIGSIPLDYGPDPGNQIIKLSFAGVPEVVMKLWEAEYLDRQNIDGPYLIKDHRGKTFTVKWKSFGAECIGTLPQDDVMFWLDHYQQLYTTAMDPLDVMHADIADIYQVTMEFYALADSIFPNPYTGI